jgi:hypothetical protein
MYNTQTPGCLTWFVTAHPASHAADRVVGILRAVVAAPTPPITRRLVHPFAAVARVRVSLGTPYIAAPMHLFRGTSESA